MRLPRLLPKLAPSRLVILLAWLGCSPTAYAAFANLSGTVTDENGAGIFGVQINFVDVCTGATAAASGNITSSTGTFRATVTAGIYDLEFGPPAGSLFTAHRIREFDLTVTRTLAPIALRYGVVVSGRVTDAAGAGIFDVFARFFPPGGSERVFTVRDRTDPSGNYSVAVPPGTYDVRYGPPLGTRYVARSIPSVPIPGNALLPPVALEVGLLVSGKALVNNGNSGVVNVNMDAVVAASGENLFLSHDRTGSTGAFSLAVPPGVYFIDYKPQPCALLVAQETGPFVVSADLVLSPVNLATGVPVQGTVTDTRGVPVADVNTNYIGSNGVQVFTVEDHTDSSGFYRAIVPRDIYNIDYAPPAGLRLAGVKTTGVEILGNTTLPPVQLPEGVVVSGRVVRLGGEPVAGIDLDFFDRLASGDPKIYTPHDVTDASGRFLVVVVPGVYDVRFEPPSTTTLAALRLRRVDVSSDQALGDIVIPQGYAVSGRVTDLRGFPVFNADLDFFDSHTGDKAETFHDNTDEAGFYSVVVPARLWSIEAVPPVDTPLETGRLEGVPITANRGGLDIVLRGAALVTGRLRDPFGQGVGGADLDFFPAGSVVRQATSRDDTALDGSGSFAVYVPPGVYDILLVPSSTSGLAPLRLIGVDVADDLDLGDLFLGWAITPSVASITPSAGPAWGGTAVTILGSGFQEGAKVSLGGFALGGVRVVNPSQIEALTPAIPAGDAGAVVDLAVANWGAPPVTLPAAFTYSPAAMTIRLTAARVAPSIILSWETTGQPRYTVFRSTSPSLFGPAQTLTTLNADTTAFTDVGGDADGIDYYYRVE